MLWKQQRKNLQADLLVKQSGSKQQDAAGPEAPPRHRLWGSEQRKDSYQVNLGTKDTDWWGRGGAGGGCMLVLQGRSSLLINVFIF